MILDRNNLDCVHPAVKKSYHDLRTLSTQHMCLHGGDSSRMDLSIDDCLIVAARAEQMEYITSGGGGTSALG